MSTLTAAAVVPSLLCLAGGPVRGLAPVAHAASCQGVGGIVDATRHEGTVEVSEDVGFSQLSRMTRKGGSAFGVQMRTTGLTVVQMGVRSSYEYTTMRTSDGFCSRIDKVDLEIGFFDPVQVYLASELGGYPCARMAVYQHEMKHVEFYQRALSEGVSKVESYVDQALDRTGWSFTGRSGTAAEKGMQSMVDSIVLKAMTALQKDADARNATIDTLDSYRALTRSCPDWPPFT